MTKRTTGFIAAVLLALLLSSCGGGTPFTPLEGPFSGSFVVNGNVVGSFSLTTQGTLIAGSGSITHLGTTRPVSISANRNDASFVGTVRNAGYGGGNISGVFDDPNSCHGAFNFVDDQAVELIEGTWTAESPLP